MFVWHEINIIYTSPSTGQRNIKTINDEIFEYKISAQDSVEEDSEEDKD